MITGIIADTHDNTGAISAAVEILNSRGVSLVLHAGDMVSPFTAKPFKNLKAPMRCVFGNNDGDRPALMRAYRDIGDFEPGWRKIDSGGALIYLSHRAPFGYPGEFDLYVFGHTHEPLVRKEGGGLIVNPGEAGGWLSGRRTLAVADLEKKEAEIIEF